MPVWTPFVEAVLTLNGAMQNATWIWTINDWLHFSQSESTGAIILCRILPIFSLLNDGCFMWPFKTKFFILAHVCYLAYDSKIS